MGATEKLRISFLDLDRLQMACDIAERIGFDDFEVKASSRRIYEIHPKNYSFLIGIVNVEERVFLYLERSSVKGYLKNAQGEIDAKALEAYDDAIKSLENLRYRKIEVPQLWHWEYD
jgi:hypothetical protein